MDMDMTRGLTDGDGLHPIWTVQGPGLTLSQGPTVAPFDVRRGCLPTDMHGMLAVDIGGAIAVGRPVPRLRGGV